MRGQSSYRGELALKTPFSKGCSLYSTQQVCVFLLESFFFVFWFKRQFFLPLVLPFHFPPLPSLLWVPNNWLRVPGLRSPSPPLTVVGFSRAAKRSAQVAVDFSKASCRLMSFSTLSTVCPKSRLAR